MQLPSAAENSFCGAAASTGEVSDLSLEHAIRQPASMVTCSQGYFLEKCGDHENANKVFDKCIAAGYAGAMIWKALLLDDGAGVEQDLPKAAELLHRAAISGDPAYGPVGKMHYATVLYLGRGVTQDRAEAMKWFQAAAAEGNPEAKDFLATNYHTGYRDQQGMGAGTPTSAALAPLANAVSEERHAVPALRRNAVAMRADQGTSAPILPPASPLPPATAITPTTPPQAIQGQQLALRTSPTPSSATGASVLLIALLLISFAFGALRKKRRRRVR
ncbi:tetratricopeptide repeat protein [Herbaspirillum autotrophicum]|uniref:tetratricopeptide repeat protein n=1 Tax=Herbaspirillum autotrophicum TaxID=180195 RepID=UPI0018DB3728|nr:SEL1-like repeat protein [Herbaspirillum autotrophicum]